jgi:hypothetical protein
MWPIFQTIAWKLVRLWHRFQIWYRNTFVFKIHVAQDDATLYYPNHTEEWQWAAIHPPYPEDCIVVREKRRHRPSGRGEHHLSIIVPNNPIDAWTPIRPPWWFVGAQMDDGNTIAITDTLSRFLVIGNQITPTLLERLNRDIPTDRLLRWMYVDPETFEERTFPSEGIVVQSYDDLERSPPQELPHEE